MEAALIDNNDSFTYNIVELVRKIDGVTLEVIPYEELRVDDLSKFKKLIISPGPGLPHEFPHLQDVLQAYHSEIPILGICLGHEAIACFFGAELTHLPTVVHGQPREINVTAPSLLFKGLPQNFKAGLYHSWVVDKHKLPAELMITAFSEDNNIMSFRHSKYDLFGVQFHPESIITEYGKEMMTNFLSSDGGE